MQKHKQYIHALNRITHIKNKLYIQSNNKNNASICIIIIIIAVAIFRGKKSNFLSIQPIILSKQYRTEATTYCFNEAL
jgi:hypothetical protein